VRWTHPAHGPISPAEFVPLIAQAGLIGRLTRLVLRRAIEAAAAFRAAGLDISISVNLTPRDLLDPNLVGDLERLLVAEGLDPNALQVEVTEDAMVVDFETSAYALCQLRDRGIAVAIDDFGTGYSSLQHLHRLPVDELKIDRSFVSRLTTDDSAEAIVRASINLARDLRLSTVAEGIEDEHTLRVIARLGCTEMQGFLVSRPVPLHDFIHWARDWDPGWMMNALNERETTIGSTETSNEPVLLATPLLSR
jgi:EAL domain-containing protein (putative c-di-GMP-specific phosphodiesterase class I)